MRSAISFDWLCYSWNMDLSCVINMYTNMASAHLIGPVRSLANDCHETLRLNEPIQNAHYFIAGLHAISLRLPASDLTWQIRHLFNDVG